MSENLIYRNRDYNNEMHFGAQHIFDASHK